MNFWNVTLTVFSIMMLALAPAALAQDDAPDALAGSGWLLVSLDGAPLVDDSAITLQFDSEGALGGSGGCNRYGGMYSLDGDSIDVGGVFSTQMACAEDIMAQEYAYFEALEAASTYAIEGDTLTLTTEEGATLVFEREATLDGTAWVLVSLDGAPVVDGSEVTLQFGADNRVSGSGGCNSFGGPYLVDGDSIAFGMLASTLMACMDEDLMQQEAAFFQALNAVSSYAIEGNTLTLTTDDGATLILERVQTLVGTTWQLVSLDGAPLVSGDPITLQFGDDARVAGSAGCNRYGGPYSVMGENIAFGMLVSTRMACPGAGVMEQEMAYLTALETATRYTIDGEELVIETSSGPLVYTHGTH